MADTDKPGHTDVAAVMVEVPVQAIATLYQAVARAAGGAAPGAGVGVDSPAQAVALLSQVASQSTGLNLQHDVQSQQSLNQIANAVVSKAVATIMAIGEVATVVPPDAAVVGEAPAVLMGALYQTMGHSTGIQFENAVAAQQQDTLEQAAANEGVMQIYSLDTGADGIAAKPSRRLDDTD